VETSLAITGFSGSGKTTFIEKLIPLFREKEYSVGYIKHTGHPHLFDTPNKDTYRQTIAGACFSTIFSEKYWSIHWQEQFQEQFLRLSPADIQILEGFKQYEGLKLVCVHPVKGIPKGLEWNQLNEKEQTNIIAYLTPTTEYAQEMNLACGKTVAYCRDDIQSIFPKILKQWLDYQNQKVELNAAILVGGQSKRMGKDKFLLDYGKGHHPYYLKEVLEKQQPIKKIYYSGREEQESNLKGNWITDSFLRMGPLGGILSLFQKQPQSAWLVVGCDLACIQTEIIDYLISHRNPLKHGTFFKSSQGDWLETLVGIYEPSIIPSLHFSLAKQQYSLQKILRSRSIEMLTIPEQFEEQLFNANTPEEYQKAQKYWTSTKNDFV
jgi:molybdopterin-guanine dinucleotide biosynthesis protein A